MKKGIVVVLFKKMESDICQVLVSERKNVPYGLSGISGHSENGESFQDTALRELKEELGLIDLEPESLESL